MFGALPDIFFQEQVFHLHPTSAQNHPFAYKDIDALADACIAGFGADSRGTYRISQLKKGERQKEGN